MSRFLLAALTLPAVGVLACGDDDDDGAIEVRDTWARATPSGATTGAVYMTLRADADDTLVGVTIDDEVAAGAMAHETVSAVGQVTMDDTAGVALPAGEDVVFEPGGLHVMLEELTQPIAAGESFELTLDFEVAPDLTVTVDVREDAP